MKYNIDRIAKVTLVNLLCLFIGSTFGALLFGNLFAGVYVAAMGVMLAWPALILAAVYTDRLLIKQAAELNKTEQR
jgi:hypothetical protein